MENKSYSHTVWEERILKKQNQSEEKEPVFKAPQDEESRKSGGPRKIFLAVFFLFFLFAVFYISRVFLQNEDAKLSPEPSVKEKQGEKTSMLGSLINILEDLSVFHTPSNGGIQKFAFGEE